MDMQALCKELELKKPTVNNFINLLEATHLISKLPPFGYLPRKSIDRTRFHAE
jgi:predicted AAA+ superfamily ATPase